MLLLLHRSCGACCCCIHRRHRRTRSTGKYAATSPRTLPRWLNTCSRVSNGAAERQNKATVSLFPTCGNSLLLNVPDDDQTCAWMTKCSAPSRKLAAENGCIWRFHDQIVSWSEFIRYNLRRSRDQWSWGVTEKACRRRALSRNQLWYSNWATTKYKLINLN